jgi:hypothetical protein
MNLHKGRRADQEKHADRQLSYKQGMRELPCLPVLRGRKRLGRSTWLVDGGMLKTVRDALPKN